MNLKIHPHEVVADFVNKYINLIEPKLKEGKPKEIEFILGDVVIRAAIYFEDNLTMPLANKGVYGKYRMAINNLNRLINNSNLNSRIIELTMDTVSRFVEDLDLMLKDDPHYKEIRRVTN